MKSIDHRSAGNIYAPVRKVADRAGSMATPPKLCFCMVGLATGIPKEVCGEINLGYRDPSTIDPHQFANREKDGILLVPKASEMLYHLRQRPDWAREM